ncbi:MAG: hypothetical protein AAFX79_10360 [Planctomycetota bacterium]
MEWVVGLDHSEFTFKPGGAKGLVLAALVVERARLSELEDDLERIAIEQTGHGLPIKFNMADPKVYEAAQSLGLDWEDFKARTREREALRVTHLRCLQAMRAAEAKLVVSVKSVVSKAKEEHFDGSWELAFENLLQRIAQYARDEAPDRVELISDWPHKEGAARRSFKRVMTPMWTNGTGPSGAICFAGSLRDNNFASSISFQVVESSRLIQAVDVAAGCISLPCRRNATSEPTFHEACQLLRDWPNRYNGRGVVIPKSELALFERLSTGLVRIANSEKQLAS